MQAKPTNTKLYINQGKRNKHQCLKTVKKVYKAHPAIVQTAYMDA